MKRLLFVTALVFFVFPEAAVPQATDIYARPHRTERSRDYEARHYRIQLRLADQQRSFWGQTTITFRSLTDNLAQCDLDAGTYKVTGVVAASGKSLLFRQTDSTLIVSLHRQLAYHDTTSIIVTYESIDHKTDPVRWGMPAGYDLGLDFKAATEDNPALVNTLSFPEGARHWFPCNDQPDDKATAEIIVTVRDDWKVLSNGQLIGDSHHPAQARRTFHWSMTQPHSTYLFVMVAGPYVVLPDSLGALPINYWVYPQAVHNAKRSFHPTPQIIAFFNHEYGFDYPWPKYDQITIPGIGGGAESTTATVVGQRIVHDEKAEKDFSAHWLVAHEAAHQWWGNLVTMRTWSETWINESFATYGEYLYSRHSLGDDEAAINLLEKKNGYLHEARTKYLRPIVFDRYTWANDNFDRHTYQKGAVVLHMLRQIMGELPFRRALSHFLHKHAFQAVDTHDLIVAIKEATGQNMGWFFEQWVYKPGHPVLDISYTYGGEQLTLLVKQVQDTASGVPIFTMPVNLTITTETGSTHHKLWLKQAAASFTLACKQPPLLVRFDADNTLLKEWSFRKTVTELIYQVHHDDGIGRMWAAEQLGRFLPQADAEQALRKSAATDRFWAVRRAAVSALGNARARQYLDDLTAACADPNSRVRVAALAALGDLRLPELVPFLQKQFQHNDSYLAQAEALRALGKCGTAAEADFLQAAATIKSPRQVIKNAAIWALAEVTK